MEEEKKTQNSPKDRNIVYALADYKQLVLQYKTKQAELIKALSFWKASSLWLAAAAILSFLFASVEMNEGRRQAAENRNTLSQMSGRIQVFSEQLEGWQAELKSSREELERKKAQVSQLQKSLSTASKKQVEKLLKDAEEQ